MSPNRNATSRVVHMHHKHAAHRTPSAAMYDTASTLAGAFQIPAVPDRNASFTDTVPLPRPAPPQITHVESNLRAMQGTACVVRAYLSQS